MDYLKSFIIGTSGLVVTQHLLPLLLQDPSSYGYPFSIYSIVAPLYYGLMNMLALYLGKKFNLTLGQRLFVTSIISIIFIVSLNYFVSRHLYVPYKDYDIKGWIRYIFRNGSRHLIAFNIIIYFLEKYFSENIYLKTFVIGSSALSYLITFLKVYFLDKAGITNYDFNTFAVFEPYIQGFDLLAYVIIFNQLLGFSLPATLLIWNVFGSLLWLFLATTGKTYKYQGWEWLSAFLRVLTTGTVKMFIFYYLLTQL